MTQDDIIRMARKAHLDVYGLGKSYEAFASALERFFHAAYAAGAVAEREACAQVCDEIANKPSNMVLGVALDCAAAIRARGEK